MSLAFLEDQRKTKNIFLLIDVDITVVRFVKAIIKNVSSVDPYWDDFFPLVDNGLYPLQSERYESLKYCDFPPLLLESRGDFYSYRNGRHRHALLLVRFLLDNKSDMSVHFVFPSWNAETGIERKQLLVLSSVNSRFFFYDHYKGVIRSIHENDFDRRDYTAVKFGEKLVKFTGPRREVMRVLNQFFYGPYAPEGLESVIGALSHKFHAFISGLGTIFDVVVRIGECRNSVNSTVDKFKDMCSSIGDSSPFQLIKSHGLKLLRILASSLSLYNAPEIGLVNIAPLVLDILDFFNATGYKQESLETVVLAGMAAVLPSNLLTILRQMSCLTSKKLFDDSGLLFEAMSLVSSLFKTILDFTPLTLRPYLHSILNAFGIEEFLCLHKAKKILQDYARDKKVIISPAFRSLVCSVYGETAKIDIRRFFAKSKQLNDLFLEFHRLYKGVLSYEQASRVEPNCFIFEGPPGCRKSVTMNKIIAVMGLTHYAHTVKSAEDGKDWYDSYNNEDVFFMDDVGQMGKSQWRNVINWVSSVKLPLDCAEASLKDTKYFNSGTILLTTNNFMNLGGFTAKDCIETPEALWRRGYVFDMSGVVSEGQKMRGIVIFRHFDIHRHTFVEGFPSEFSKFCAEEGVVLPIFCDTQNEEAYLLWVTSIVMGFKKMKEKQNVSNKVGDDVINNIRMQNPFIDTFFDAEVHVIDFARLPETLEEETSWRELFHDYFDYCLEAVKDMVASAVNLLWAHPLEATASLATITVFMSILYKLGFRQEGGLLSKSKVDGNDLQDKFECLDEAQMHTLVSKVSRSVFEATVHYKEWGVERSMNFHAFVSERNVIVPYHAILDRNFQLTIYKNRKKNHIYVDHAITEVVFIDKNNDVAILRLNKGFPTPFPKLAHCFFGGGDIPVGLVFPNKVVKLEGILIKDSSEIVVYPITEKLSNTLHDPCIYKDLHYPGMCGVPLITAFGKIKGMHIAGNDSKGLGVSIVWGRSCLESIRQVLDTPDGGLRLACDISEKLVDDCSGIKIKTDLVSSTPKNSNYVASPLFNLFENTRKPANLQVYGPHTVKDIAKAARTPVKFADPEALRFAEDALHMYFCDYTDLSERQVVLGDDVLARMNKKSSNGFFPLKTKEECFDYNRGEFTNAFSDLYAQFLQHLRDGSIEPKDIAWFETLKDELRNEEKTEPRSFRVSPVTVQVLTKTCFGNLVKHLYKERWFNEIMIGINPVKDWGRLYNSFSLDRMFAGDIKRYDKNMLCQVQHIVVKVMIQHYKGDYKDEAEKILYNLMHSLVVVNDDSWILTHSLPSGSWLTAIFNSLINRVYTLMWYYTELKGHGIEPNKFNFHDDVVDYVYGDDRVNCCKNPKLAGILNAITMTKFFSSIGMDMTSSTKQCINTPFQSLEEVTFLKRSFVFHPVLEQIVCPLDLRTIYSSLSWIDQSKESLDTVLRDKINVFQREMFLHYELFAANVDKLVRYCEDRNINCVRLPERYLVELYSAGDYLDFYKFELLK